MKKLCTSVVSVCLAATMSMSAMAADIVIGIPNWVSVNAMGHVVQRVLEDNLGLDVEIQNATNPIVFEAMDKGTMHVHPEVWIPNQDNLHNTYVNDKGTVTRNPNAVIAFQGMCVPTAASEKHGITSVTQLTDPNIAKLFDSDGDGKGEIWIGATGWASTNVEYIRAKSYGYDQTLDLIEMDETLALAKAQTLITQGKPVVFMCYTPHHMFGSMDLTVLKEPAHDRAKWVIVQPTDDPDWLEKSSAPVAWGDTYLHIYYAKALEQSHPQAAQILSNIKVDAVTVSGWVYEIAKNKVDPAEVAKKWVEENADLVDTWL